MSVSPIAVRGEPVEQHLSIIQSTAGYINDIHEKENREFFGHRRAKESITGA